MILYYNIYWDAFFIRAFVLDLTYFSMHDKDLSIIILNMQAHLKQNVYVMQCQSNVMLKYKY